MKTWNIILLLLAISDCATHTTKIMTFEPTKEVLQATELSKQVKLFEKQLGIRTGASLSQNYSEKNPESRLFIWLQKKGYLKYPALRLQVKFNSEKEKVALKNAITWDSPYSIYFRIENEFSDKTSVITKSFASYNLWRQITVIIHEDLHSHFSLPLNYEEQIITPLGDITATKFLIEKNNEKELEKLKKNIKQLRALSQELNNLVRDAEKTFDSDNLEESRKILFEKLKYYNVYSRTHAPKKIESLEAKISHDLTYWSLYDFIFFLYERLGNYELLLKKLEKLPNNEYGIETEINILKEKYKYSH
ncbi:hypothetical protein HYS99_00685 [Candidatus Giovannonibacteria bacterium]|nr:hypothetical protein [Candidatus Giovannonibacteria bacterium]